MLCAIASAIATLTTTCVLFAYRWKWIDRALDTSPRSRHNGYMKRAKISQLRNHLSEFLDHVRAGGHVLVLDRDRPIAEIIPVRATASGKGAPDAERLAALEREGIVHKPSGQLPPELLHEAPPGKGAGVLAALLEERESTR